MLWALQAMTGDHVYRFQRSGSGAAASWSIMTISDWAPRDGSNLRFRRGDQRVSPDQMFGLLCKVKGATNDD